MISAKLQLTALLVLLCMTGMDRAVGMCPPDEARNSPQRYISAQPTQAEEKEQTLQDKGSICSILEDFCCFPCWLCGAYMCLMETQKSFNKTLGP